jgi:hypothetical protein
MNRVDEGLEFVHLGTRQQDSSQQAFERLVEVSKGPLVSTPMVRRVAEAMLQIAIG